MTVLDAIVASLERRSNHHEARRVAVYGRAYEVSDAHPATVTDGHHVPHPRVTALVETGDRQNRLRFRVANLARAIRETA